MLDRGLENHLETYLEQWHEWGLHAKPTLIRVFTEGKNHTTALIKSGQSDLVLKVFNHSFDQAVNAQKTAYHHGAIAPKVLFAEKPIAVMEFVQSSQPNIGGLAKALSRLHCINISESKPFDLKGFYSDYLTTADETVRAWNTQLVRLIDEFIDDPTPCCFCHNDLVVENCMGSNQHAVFIDWEYAQTNNPWFDLAAIVLYRNLDTEQAHSFLSAYQDDWSHTMTERIFISSQLALLWGDLLWHLNKYGNAYRLENKPRFTKLAELAQLLGVSLRPA